MGPYGFYGHLTTSPTISKVPWTDLRGTKLLVDGNGLMFFLKDNAFGSGSRGKKPRHYLRYAGAFQRSVVVVVVAVVVVVVVLVVGGGGYLRGADKQPSHNHL